MEMEDYFHTFLSLWESDLHRAATTNYPCCDQALGDSKGAGRTGLSRFAVAKI